MNSNQLAKPILFPDKHSASKFSITEKGLVIPRIASFQKNKISSPPHQSHLSPPKGPNPSENEVAYPLYAYQSFGSKSCTKICTAGNTLDVANQEDKKSNQSHDKKRVHIKMPNFLLSLSEMSNKKTQKTREVNFMNSNDKAKISKMIVK